MPEPHTADRIVPVVLCGGSGTRLWPRSRQAKPKPFLPLIGGRTLFERSLDRVADRTVFDPPIIVAGEAHVGHIENQASDVEGLRLMVEPAAKNTAPAIALAAAMLPDDAVMLVCPSDHHIADEEAFLAGVVSAAELARAGHLVAFGIAPAAPETGYGYIRRGGTLGAGFRIAEFVEKPDLATARRFVASGDFSWNGGIFAFPAGLLRDELRNCRPEMADRVERAVAAARRDGARIDPAAAPFASIEGESIDYAVMEHTDRAAMVSVDMGWSDIGSWDALMAARKADADGNVAVGPAELVQCRNVMVDSDGKRVSVVGLEDVIVVVDGDEILVTSRAGAQSVGAPSGARGE